MPRSSHLNVGLQFVFFVWPYLHATSSQHRCCRPHGNARQQGSECQRVHRRLTSLVGLPNWLTLGHCLSSGWASTLLSLLLNVKQPPCGNHASGRSATRLAFVAGLLLHCHQAQADVVPAHFQTSSLTGVKTVKQHAEGSHVHALLPWAGCSVPTTSTNN